LVATLIGIDVRNDRGQGGADPTSAANGWPSFPQPHPMSRPSAGAAEQDPGDWMRSVLDALAGFAAQHDLRGLAGIGICSQVNTHVIRRWRRRAGFAGDHLARTDAPAPDATSDRRAGQPSAEARLVRRAGARSTPATRCRGIAFVARTEPETMPGRHAFP